MTSQHVFPIKCLSMALVCAGLLSMSAAEEAKYDFDHLSDGFLPKRDDWVICLNVCYPRIGAGEGSNTTQVLTIGGGAGGVFRPMDKKTFSGTEVKAWLEADIQWNGPTQEERSTTVGLTVNDEFKSKPAITLISPRIGLFSTFSKSKNTPANHLVVIVFKGGKEVFLRAPLPESVQPGDWLRLRLEMNFLDNGGNGRGALLYKNLTKNETAFSPSGLDGIDLGLKELSGRAAQPANWNAWVIRLVNVAANGGSGFAIDNLAVSSD